MKRLHKMCRDGACWSHVLKNNDTAHVCVTKKAHNTKAEQEFWSAIVWRRLWKCSVNVCLQTRTLLLWFSCRLRPTSFILWLNVVFLRGRMQIGWVCEVLKAMLMGEGEKQKNTKKNVKLNSGYLLQLTSALANQLLDMSFIREYQSAV